MRLSPRSLIAVVALLVLLLATPVQSMKQTWQFRGDDRRAFLIERFGFAPGATMKLRVSNVGFAFTEAPDTPIDGNRPREKKTIRAGLLFVHEDKLWDTMSAMQGSALDDDATETGVALTSSTACLLENRTSAMWVDFVDETTWAVDKVVASSASDVVDATPRPGFYYIFYAQCTKGMQISFDMEAEFRNHDGNYLSAGDSALPSVYLLMSLLFCGAAVAWGRHLRAQQSNIHSVHHMMSIVIVLKTVSLFAESMRYFYMKRHGDTMTSWTSVYYVFVFMKGVMLFTVLLLIGTGWSLLKAHLSTRDKTIISVVLVLQVLSNTAMIVMEESDVGTRAWVTWRDVLHLMDILCCFAILVPIVWSIRNLRQSATTDGKAHINLRKLTQFRSFYLMVVTYIYVTRIALFILTASLPYNATWISVLVGEGAAFAFFTLTGYRFRPQDQHPYLEVSTHVESLEEFALDDDDEDLEAPVQRRDHGRFNLRPPSPKKAFSLRPTALQA
ncbi:hypothetical protein P43SY_004538 [Pythium insidiosum]|uniref:GOST seven transmembrane domain-containing protein n=1 Tax=Pythium insidiosum TaxID=114742 RepID=A0AAD5QDL7_PYTIN|nr:hypothetical protein P43SY_004538 [Pythium insidiosum]